MSTNSGNTDLRYKIRCYDDRYILALELQERTLSHAMMVGAARRKEGYKRVFIRRTKGLKHDFPIEWKYSIKENQWMPTKFYDELANGKRAPSAEKVPPGLFADAV